MRRNNIFWAVVGGGMLTFGFPGLSLYWIAWFAIVPLLWAVRDLDGRRSFFAGMITGLAHYLSLLYWLVGTMKIYGLLPLPVGIALLLLLSSYMALYLGVFAYAVNRFCRRPTFALFGFVPVFWTALEYIRTYFLTGFPWALLGYSQYRVSPMIQIADLGGVYAVSFLTACINSAAFIILLYVLKATWRMERVGGRTLVRVTVVCAALAAGDLSYGMHRMGQVDAATASAPRRRVSIVQGNVDQAVKWDPMFQIDTIQKYQRLSSQALGDRPDLIVWPETAAPFYFQDPYVRSLKQLLLMGIRKTGVDFLIGSPAYEKKENITYYYNSAFLISASGETAGRYDKAHLVPYGEYIPLKRFFPFINKLVAGIGDFRGGEPGKTIEWQGTRIGIQICFEAIFPQLARAMANNGATFLVNMTNDAWFGRTAAPYQHLSMTIFRAVENRRMLVRCANTGISAFIDPVGRVASATPLYAPAVETLPVPLLRMKTVYTRMGDILAWACLAILLLFAILRYKYNRVKDTK